MRAQTRGFLARHWLVVGLVAICVALSVGFSIAAYEQSKRVTQLREVAEAERASAQASHQRAEALSKFLLDAFADPAQARCNDLTALEVFQQDVTRICNDLSANPGLHAKLFE